MVSTVVGTVGVLVWRMRETSRPISPMKIIMPPLGMLTGLAMFLYPPTHVPLHWALSAFLLGVLVLSYPLVRTSRLIVDGDSIKLQRSKAFLWILLGLVTLRLGLREYVEHLISPLQTAGLAYLLALGMILRWRIGMLIEYRRLHQSVGR
jgi:membrane protein CcdC involved in cytochrome C biogenesis